MKKISLKSVNIARFDKTPEENSDRKTVIKNKVLQARLNADKIIRQAKIFAEEIKQNAELEADQRVREKIEKETEKALFEINQKLLEINSIREKILLDTEKDILRLSVKLAEKIVGRELEINRETVLDIISSALQNTRQQDRLTLRVNPNDLNRVQKQTENLKNLAQTKFIDFIADPRVKAGGCLIESEVGTVDARLETQIRVLEKALLSQLEGENSEEF